MNLTPTQAALLHRGLDHFISNPDHVLESDARRVIWCLAQMATQAIAEEGTASGTLDLGAMQAASDLAMSAEPPRRDCRRRLEADLEASRQLDEPEMSEAEAWTWFEAVEGCDI